MKRRRHKQQAANSKMDHLGSVPSGFGGSPNSTLATSKQAELGGFAAGKLGFPKKKGMRPVTPRATAAPPGGAGESAQTGIARMLPAGIVSKRFQQLFKGKGHAEEDLSVAERGLSTTSTHSQAPEIPLHHEPSPTKDLERPGTAAAPSHDTPAGDRDAAAKLQRAAAAAGAAVAADGVPAVPAAAARRPLPRGSIEHEVLPIKLSGRARSGSIAGGPAPAAVADRPARGDRISHNSTKIKLGGKYDGPK
ncbi:hypothetical protein COCSUDRAFT_53534 [Coccomyxa subellipsoidea C-169]|uniref:Uncharacterized protein n=1 Tax=Coccomyxa subellipsoidea (strain C-169) TaxID=574566 RepID=I0YXQ7_COCSC|nr:hypothetical protein COCSUDRAFT_53534 [Coccomyxa subellipsoidea C-169]EIE23176.1 hypothetical protein COCSUDRAFT_53534 [Coccomyxa subellipsoidea C-169]|eukprot:XP_005647720.1 hypothetical protein COCSUDRAFT_53534 [Coccomyxa subellipsoidea C-169]